MSDMTILDRFVGLSSVMPGLVPGIHALLTCQQDVDGRDKPGQDDEKSHGREKKN
jgi:hypothetical protein